MAEKINFRVDLDELEALRASSGFKVEPLVGRLLSSPLMGVFEEDMEDALLITAGITKWSPEMSLKEANMKNLLKPRTLVSYLTPDGCQNLSVVHFVINSEIPTLVLTGQDIFEDPRRPKKILRTSGVDFLSVVRLIHNISPIKNYDNAVAWIKKSYTAV